MKKAFLFVMMLLSFAAMASASFTIPSPDERDDGASLCAYNFNTSSEAQPEQNGAMGTIYLLPFGVPASKASCTTVELCSCSDLENAEQLQSALSQLGVYGCPSWTNAVLVSSSETESTYHVGGVASSADGPVNVGARIHCTLHWGQSPNNGPPYAYTTCTWDLEMFRWDDLYGGYISR